MDDPPPPPSSKPSSKKWVHQHERILKEWGEIARSYKYLHDAAQRRYYRQNLGFSLPIIIISTCTGTASFALSSFPPSWQPYAPSVIGGLNLIGGLISTISQFLRVSELLAEHKTAAINFGKFSRSIAVELSLPVDQREMSGFDFIMQSKNTLNTLLEQSPCIPEGLTNKFIKQFKQDDSFTKPDLMSVRPVEIYNDADHAAKEAAFLNEQAEKIALDELKAREEAVVTISDVTAGLDGFSSLFAPRRAKKVAKGDGKPEKEDTEEEDPEEVVETEEV